MPTLLTIALAVILIGATALFLVSIATLITALIAIIKSFKEDKINDGKKRDA